MLKVKVYIARQIYPYKLNSLHIYIYLVVELILSPLLGIEPQTCKSPYVNVFARGSLTITTNIQAHCLHLV